MTWQTKHAPSPCWSVQPYPGAAHQRSSDTYIYTQIHTRARRVPPQCSPLTYDHHCRPTQTQGPRWHNQRSAGQKRTLVLWWDFVKVKVFLGCFFFSPFLHWSRVLIFLLTFPSPAPSPLPGAKMSCRKRCKREIFKFAQYLFRLVTGTLNTGKAPGGLWERIPPCLRLCDDSLKSTEIFVSSSWVKLLHLIDVLIKVAHYKVDIWHKVFC